MSANKQSNWYLLVFVPFALFIYMPFYLANRRNDTDKIKITPVDSTKKYTIMQWDSIQELENRDTISDGYDNTGNR